MFNRSHYDDVLVPAVNGQIDEAETRRRYAQFNAPTDDGLQRKLSRAATPVAGKSVNTPSTPSRM